MNEAEELLQQTQVLAEALRTAATELLSVTRKMNTVYTQFGEYMTEMQERALEAEVPVEEEALGEVPKTSEGIDPNDLCENCNAYLPQDDDHCIICGHDREDDI